MTKKIITVVAVAAAIFGAHASGARLDVANSFTLSGDESNILYYPSEVNNYADVVEANANAASGFTASFIGVKGLNDMLNLGTYILAGGSAYIASNFIQQALLYTNINGNTPNNFQPIPHILLGLNLDAVSIGVDLFLENSIYKHDFFAEAGTPAITDRDTDVARLGIRNFGFKLDANISLGSLYILPGAALYFPRLYGNHEVVEIDLSVSPNVTTTTTNKYSTEGIGLAPALEVGMEMGDNTVIAGIGFIMENYQFIGETTVGNVTTTSKSTPVEYRELSPYIGIVLPLANELLVTAMYNYTWTSNSTVTDTANSKYKLSTKTVSHHADLGVERPFECNRFLDEVTPRCGFLYQLGDDRQRDKYELPNKVDNKTNEAANGSLGAHVGLGLKKGIATFDASCQLASWSSGILTGPSVFSAAVTVDFKNNSKVNNRKGGKSEPVSGYSAPEPAAAPSYTPAEENTSTGGSFDF